MWQSPENVIENPALHNRSPVFADRPDAGAGLALLMGEWVNRDAVICAIPAGGVVVAVPTGHESSIESVASACDRLYCANIREGLRFAVASAYVTWSDVSEDEVERQLMKVHQCRST